MPGHVLGCFQQHAVLEADISRCGLQAGLNRGSTRRPNRVSPSLPP
jgi:hypothetical protein